MTGKKIGLVIGNDYINSYKELKFAVADAAKIKEILEDKNICGFDEVYYFPDKTSREVSTAIEKSLIKANDDLILIYYSGLGKRDWDNNLCLIFNDTLEDAFLSTSLSCDFINKCIKHPCKKSVIIILECTYSGAAKLGGNYVLTSTGSTGSPMSKENEKLRHGVFTYYLIEGLEKGYADKDGDGDISMDDLFDYASKKTIEKTSELNCAQFPRKSGITESSIIIGKNPKIIKEKEYKIKRLRIVKEFSQKLPDFILEESLTTLNKNYEDPSSMEEDELEIYKVIEDLLEGKITIDNYIKTVQLINGRNIKDIKSFEYDVFICHSSKDKSIIATLIEDLKKENITYWVDAEQIKFGDQITQRIEEGLKKSKYIIPCLSTNFNMSGWTRAEYSSILTREFKGKSKRIVIPLMLDDYEDDDIPDLLYDKRRITYSNKEEFYEFIEFLKS